MASKYAVTKEFTNFARACRINIDVFRDVFWEVVIKYIPANQLVSTIQAFLQPLPVQQYKPFHHQLNNLCQLGRAPEKTDCDISILYSIIRNVCGLSSPSAGWGKPPTLNATSWTLTDDLESLREARNKVYAHATLASITNNKFDDFIKRYKAILGRLDGRLGTTFSQCLNTIVTESLDPATYALYKRYVDELLFQKQKEAELNKLVRQLEGGVDTLKDTLTKHQSSCQSDKETFHKDIEKLKRKLQQTTNTQEALEHEVQHTTKKQKTLAHPVQDNTKKQKTLEHQVQQTTNKQEATEGRVDQIERKLDSLGTKSYADIKAYLLNLYKWSMSELEMPAWCDVTSPFQLFTPISVREDLEFKSAGHPLLDRETSGSRSGKPITSYREIFYRDDTPQRDIFMLGEAGVGKTTFCYHLVNLWCNLHERTPLPSMSDQDKDLISVLREFSFLFLIRCRDVNRNDDDLSDKPTKSVFQMIKRLCPKSPNEVIVEIFNAFKGKCLVIIDGLDEWVYSASEESGTLSPKGLPDCKDVFGSTVLMTSRPWRVEALGHGLPPFCRVLQIDGLEEGGVETLSCKILKTIYLSKGEGDVKTVYDKFHQQLKQHKMQEIVRQPLMLHIILREWHSGKQTLNRSLSINYTGLIESVLNHSEEKMLHKLVKTEREEDKQPLPSCFQRKETCLKYSSQIRKIASLAFDTLVRQDKEKSLVFTKKELVDHVGNDDLDLCLRLGILSASKASSESNVRLVTISFLHKSIQECLASVHISEDRTGQCLTEFTSKLNYLSDIFDVGNILIFLFGMSPSKGQEVMKHVCDVVEHCPVVKAYRQTSLSFPFSGEVDNLAIAKHIQQLYIHCILEQENSGMCPSRQDTTEAPQQTMEHVCDVVEHCPVVKAYSQIHVNLQGDVNYMGSDKLIQQLYTRCIVEQEHSGMCPSRHDTTKAPGYCIPDIMISNDTLTDMVQDLLRPGKHIKSLMFYDYIITPAYIIQSLNKTLKHLEKLQLTVPGGSEGKHIQQLCQSLSSLKQLKSFCLCGHSVLHLFLAQATYLFTELGKLPSLMSLGLSDLDLTAMGNCQFPKNVTTLHLENVYVSANLVVPQYCTTVQLLNLTVPGQVYIPPVCSKLLIWMRSISDLFILPNSLTKLVIDLTLSPAAQQHLYTLINTTSGLQVLTLSAPKGSRISLCKQVDMSRHLSLDILHLQRADLEGCGIVLSHNVRKVGMYNVSMSGEHWYQAVENMSSCHYVDMELVTVRRLDQRTVEFIRQHFKVTRNETNTDGDRTICFHTNRSTN